MGCVCLKISFYFYLLLLKIHEKGKDNLSLNSLAELNMPLGKNITTINLFKKKSQGIRKAT